MIRAVLRIASLLLVGAGIAYGASLAWNSSQLELRRVEVAGNDRVSAQQIAAAPELKRGDHLIRISTSNVRRAVEEIPWVRSARVERIIPSTIRITVTERTAHSVLIAANGPFLIDGERVVLEAQSQPASLVRIDAAELGELEEGQTVDAVVIEHAISILDSLPDDLRSAVVSVQAAAVDRITLSMKEGYQILYGAHEQVEDKNFAIRALLEQAETEGVEVARMDVRVPTRPALKPR